jgi:tetratricopeptide (TPR) repeat protein
VAAIPAAACAARALARRRQSGRAGRLVAVGLAGAVVGSAWTTAVWLRQRELAAAVRQYAAGRQVQKADKPGAAIDLFEHVTANWPWYANGHYRLAEALADQGRDRKALAAADAAIRRYPTGAQSVWGPRNHRAHDAYMLRSRLHDRLGKRDLADRDIQAAGRVSSFLNILGGLMRFWQRSPDEPAE